MRSLVTTSLAAAVAAAGLASGWHPTAQASGLVWASQSSQLVSQNLTPDALVQFQSGNFLVEFNEPGLVERHQVRQARASNPEPFNAHLPEVQADLEALKGIQSQHVSAIRAAGIGAPSHYYLATHSGVAVQLESQAQLDALRSLPFVKSVKRAGVETIQTHRSAAFVGADRIWNGSAVPSGVGTKGEDIVVAVLDTGIDKTRPSFSDDPSCGLGPNKPKVLSALNCSTTDTNGTCSGQDASDSVGHGTHVASTAAGNIVTRAQDPSLQPEEGDQISGIAPCAQIRAYKVCGDTTCDGAWITAGMNSALMAGDVKAFNFSISGGGSPWTDGDRKKLDLVDAGIFVAASAGNTRAATPNPIGRVNHLGPWVMTVASSTHDRQQAGAVAHAGPGSANPPAATQNMQISRGNASPAYTGPEIEIKRPQSANEAGCDPHPTDYFKDKAALIKRGANGTGEACTFVVKINHAFNAGAKLVIIRNNQPGSLTSMGTSGQQDVPAYSIPQQSVGEELATFVGSTPGATIRLASSYPEGDVLSGFSLRGPTSGNLSGLTKPDITAPGDSVFAALPSGAGGGYGWMGGTSMSGPQVAGAGALMRAAHPTWTATEVKSALMMTAKTTGKKDGVNGTPNTGSWDADDVGSGRLDLNKAAKAGLVMNETKANFLAANPADNGDPRTLNLPSMRNVNCTPSCTWTRTVRNTLDEASSWTVEGVSVGDKMTLNVSPSSFQFNAGDTDQTQVLTITATPTGDQTGAVAFGQINLKETAGKSPDLHLTVAIKGIKHAGPVIEIDPTSISAQAPSGSSTVVDKPLRIKNIGGADLNWSRDTSAGGSSEATIVDQPVSGDIGLISQYSTTQSGGATTAGDFNVAAPSTLKKIEVHGFDLSNNLPNAEKLTWVIYPDDGDKPNSSFESTPPHANSTWTFETTPTGAGVTIAPGSSGSSSIVTLDLAAAGQNVNLSAGRYWLTMYPSSATDFSSPFTSPRWNWSQAEKVGTGSMVIGSRFNVTSWTLTGQGGLDTEVQDVAFKITGTQSVSCNASWLSLDPTSGTVAGDAYQDVVVKLNPAGLADGVHHASLCLNSNSGGTAGHMTVVPVSFVVGDASASDANLAVSASSNPETVLPGGEVTFLVSAVNFGPAEASNTKIELTLPNGMSFISAAEVSAEARKQDGSVDRADRNSHWTCTSQTAKVTCTHDGPLAGIAQPLLVKTLVADTTAEGTLTTQVKISATENDPVAANNSVDVLTRVISQALFSDGFEEAIGGGDLVDSGPLNHVINENDDLQLNLVTGQFGPFDSFTGADINWYKSAQGNLSVYLFGDVSDVQGAVSIGPNQPQIAVLKSGDTVDENAPFTRVGGNNMQPWAAGTTGYLGLRFVNEATGQANYGYIKMETTGSLGFPVKVTRYVYNKAGAGVTIP